MLHKELNEEKKAFIPIGMELSETGLGRWLKQRTIPKNRAYVDAFLSKCGLSRNRPMNIISVTNGLSLNDCYWVTEKDFEGSYNEYNLYDNNFSRILGLIAFTGFGSVGRAEFTSSPEFTTNGMLKKCWRRENKEILLYKGGTSGASNTGNEPYSEYYAAQIADILGVKAISYVLSKWKGVLCSTCKLFTSKEYSYVPAANAVKDGGIEAVREYCKKLGKEFNDALDDMLVFDALICNVDRHLGNFGFLVDNTANTICAPALLFDHGNSLFSLAGLDVFDSEKALEGYVKTLMPALYDDFIGTAEKAVQKRHKEGLRRLVDFRFKRHSRYNLDKKRLTLIEGQIQKRAKQLLG